MSIANPFNNTLFFGPNGVKVQSLAQDLVQGDVFYLNSNRELVRLPIGTSGQAIVSSGTGLAWSAPSPGGSAGGSLTGTFPNPTIANDAVSFAQLQNIGTSTILGRATAGTGDPEALTAAQVNTLLGLTAFSGLSVGTAANNIPQLDGSGKLNTSVIPSLRSHEFVQVADQAARLALTVTQVQPGDEAFQADTLETYKLIATDPTQSSNWVKIADMTLDASAIVSGVFNTARLGTGTASSSTYLRGDGTWASPATGTLPRVAVTGTTQQMANNTIYHVNNASKVTLTLPTTAAVGDTIEVIGVGAGGWAIAQNAGQQIRYLNLITTAGVTGKVDTALPSIGVQTPQATISIECVTANTLWIVKTALGQVDVA